MIEAARRSFLRLLRVPPEPQPPFGAPGSVRVFRAAKSYLRLMLLGWGMSQVGAVAGIIFSVGMLHAFATEIEAATAAIARAALEAEKAAESAAAGDAAGPADSDESAAPAAPAEEVTEENSNEGPDPNEVVRRFARWIGTMVPRWVVPLLITLEVLGIAAFVAQIPLTLGIVNLEWSLRWYIVTDRSLRIRSGIWTISESTMSFANLQQVEVRQGPIQRLLGLADVRVQSAGGGGGGGDADSHGHAKRDSLHAGIFHGVENAPEIRDLILERLRRFREAGLGDPEDAGAHADPTDAAATTAPDAEAHHAARELLAEARTLRAVVTGRPV